jgi:hypothetical protein
MRPNLGGVHILSFYAGTFTLQDDQPTPPKPEDPVTTTKFDTGTLVKPARTTNGMEVAVELDRKRRSILKSPE